MDRSKLVASINEEIAKLQKVASLLGDKTFIRTANPKQRTFVMSPAARKRIGDAQRARWAKKREQNVAAERAAAKPKAVLSSSNNRAKK